MHGEIEGVPCKILCDTGACVTVVSRAIWHRTGRSAKREDGETIELATANGGAMRAKVIPDALIRLGNKDYRWRIHVAEARDDVLLGADFLKEFGAVIDMNALTMKLQPGRPGIAKVKLKKKLSCAPESRTDITVTIEPPLPEEGTYMFEPVLHNNRKGQQLMFGNSISHGGSKTTISIINDTGSPIEIKGGTLLGFSSPVTVVAEPTPDDRVQPDTTTTKKKEEQILDQLDHLLQAAGGDNTPEQWEENTQILEQLDGMEIINNSDLRSLKRDITSWIANWAAEDHDTRVDPPPNKRDLEERIKELRSQFEGNQEREKRVQLQRQLNTLNKINHIIDKARTLHTLQPEPPEHKMRESKTTLMNELMSLDMEKQNTLISRRQQAARIIDRNERDTPARPTPANHPEDAETMIHVRRICRTETQLRKLAPACNGPGLQETRNDLLEELENLPQAKNVETNNIIQATREWISEGHDNPPSVDPPQRVTSPSPKRHAR